MNKLIVYICLVFSISVFSQEDSLQVKIQELEYKIDQSKGLRKLSFIDSLYKVRKDKQAHFNDSIMRKAIDYVFKLDSIALGLKHTANYIHHLENRMGEDDKAIAFYENFLKRKIDTNTLNNSGLKSYAKILLYAGDAYYYLNQVKASIPVYEACERFALRAGDTTMYINAKDYKSNSHADIGQYVLASKSYNELLEIARKRKDSIRVSNVNAGMASLYGRMGFYQEALNLRYESIDFSESVHKYDIEKSHKHLISEFYNASIDAENLGDNSTRIQLLKKALTHMDEPGVVDIQRPLIIYGLVRAYAETNDIPAAKLFFDEMKNKYGTQEPIPYAMGYYEASVIYKIAVKDYKNARIDGEKSLELVKESNNIVGIFEAKEKLAEIYKVLGDTETSYTYYQEAIKLKDSTQNVQKTQALAYYQTLYETEKRDFKITTQQNEIIILDEKNRVKQQWLLFGGLSLLAIFTIIYLIRSRKFVKSKQELQERFSQDLINEQENERTRLARELHDSVGQKLMLLSKTTKKSGDENAEKLASTTLEEVREISQGLHPSNLERLGITESINALVYSINANTDVFFTDEIENLDNILSKESELHLYRIIQETLSNIIKHSEAKAVKMQINKTSKEIHVVISDNGKGFDVETKQKSISLGLKTLFERAKIIGAKMNLDSEISKGTKMTLTIPI